MVFFVVVEKIPEPGVKYEQTDARGKKKTENQIKQPPDLIMVVACVYNIIIC